MKHLEHIAIIMDGNGRWAEQQGQPRVSGHRRGAEMVLEVVKESIAQDIDWLTLYAFSSENWQRPEAEVEALMEILCYYVEREIDTMSAHGVRLRIVGDMDKFSPEVRSILESTILKTKDNSRLNLTLALSYGSRDELIRAVRRVVADVQCGEICPESLDQKLFSSYLDTVDIPDPDLLIRTSGEQRISNFLLWQIAYAELYFTDVCWPDFDGDALKLAIAEYSNRERRFGKTSAQIKP